MTLTMNFKDLLLENGTLIMTKIMNKMAEEMKMMQPLNLIQKSLNLIFLITLDACILVTRDIKVAGVAADTNVAFKNCAPFTRCVTHINDEHAETAENLDIIMHMYNLIEYSDNYADSSGSLYQFKRGESPINDAGNTLNAALDNSTSFKYKASVLGKATDADGNDRPLKNTKIVVQLNSNFLIFLGH